MEVSNVRRSGLPIHPCVIELREMLQSVLGDDFVRLYHYGSRVEGNAESDSDYDVLCVTRRPVCLQLRDAILYRQLDIQMDRNVLFDLHFYSEEQLHTPPLSFTPYVQRVTTDGIIV